MSEWMNMTFRKNWESWLQSCNCFFQMGKDQFSCLMNYCWACDFLLANGTNTVVVPRLPRSDLVDAIQIQYQALRARWGLLGRYHCCDICYQVVTWIDGNQKLIKLQGCDGLRNFAVKWCCFGCKVPVVGNTNYCNSCHSSGKPFQCHIIGCQFRALSLGGTCYAHQDAQNLYKKRKEWKKSKHKAGTFHTILCGQFCYVYKDFGQGRTLTHLQRNDQIRSLFTVKL